MDDELKPCPFCGSTNITDGPYLGMGCDCIKKQTIQGSWDFLVRWNTRPIEDALLAELEAARRVCELITLWADVEMTTLHSDIAKALRNWKKARE